MASREHHWQTLNGVADYSVFTQRGWVPNPEIPYLSHDNMNLVKPALHYEPWRHVANLPLDPQELRAEHRQQTPYGYHQWSGMDATMSNYSHHVIPNPPPDHFMILAKMDLREGARGFMLDPEMNPTAQFARGDFSGITDPVNIHTTHIPIASPWVAPTEIAKAQKW